MVYIIMGSKNMEEKASLMKKNAATVKENCSYYV